MTEENHAISNAKGWLASIVEQTAALAVAEEGDDQEAAEEARREIDEGPLSVQVRGGWHSPGDRDGIDAKPEEFEILLSTGGPALRIIGDLDEYGQVYGTPRLQWQDWFKPWTDYHETTDEEDAALAAYVGCFWFGE